MTDELVSTRAIPEWAVKERPRRRRWRTFLRNRTAVAGMVVALLVVMTALFAPWIAPYDPLAQNVFYRLTPPERTHLMGTDSYGRDVFSRLIWGARISLAVGILSVAFGMIAGSLLGLLAAYRGKTLGALIMRAVDVLMSFPDEILGIMILAVLGAGLDRLIIAIGIVMTPRFARLSYGPALAVKEKEYVEAARAIGSSDWKILLRHILPNVAGEIVVMGSLWTATAIRVEANLNFLGLGVPPPIPTWGNMVQSGIDQLTYAPWLSLFPGLAIMITILAFNMLGDGLRDIIDPRLQE
ncbi:MAG: ABC transporter permease [Armatimonadota bacterium]|nr:ABC transporter permease [Armatimonadota bacterium]MDR5702985.1 ABC transporter permease [Armatimonadota bacterium]MDR7433717.1 ABC transporter permease [Armatimonadota bacterium]